ncbi:hypothetical protein, unlikely [Trypanosoma brucei gambiense DAL972]|uniref:Uncharacterized protein n=1 Tax=Trypanosoma brucei gambiense (strain MHOM/CI/86/DAL972) TaxID=679716 RepID=C9ZSZ6_TRYB9|nr:hypothetical protein, unlikely [Trypanosoma brucei gambiense DAL972]CBH12531.1 hypothetical protein, unlikely [Trypanosoma brucei gambiense DAL972]|eukprot:XP_011774811.1 hypothetical protein, unlikely [Trypanosoma brucei gambiense DAL972]
MLWHIFGDVMRRQVAALFGRITYASASEESDWGRGEGGKRNESGVKISTDATVREGGCNGWMPVVFFLKPLFTAAQPLPAPVPPIRETHQNTGTLAHVQALISFFFL